MALIYYAKLFYVDVSRKRCSSFLTKFLKGGCTFAESLYNKVCSTMGGALCSRTWSFFCIGCKDADGLS